MMTFGSLFAGIGGFDLGLERAGMVCKWQVEKDPFCLDVLTKHWPNVKRYEDIHDVTKPEPVGLVCGGFPCQPYSTAGKRRGAEDDRALWPEMLRIIKEVRPAWVVGENVLGFVKMDLSKALLDLESIGFDTQAFIIPACAKNAPHRRDRVWIVAHSYSNMRELERPHNGKDRETSKVRRLRPESVRLGAFERPDYWGRDTARGDDGLSHRMDRRRALGNAVVPQVVEALGRMILQAEAAAT